jgi:thiosulfate/3-mercaptopyruvate sulfurtransferase
MGNIVNMEWLAANIDQSDVRIIDCRFDLANPKAGFEEYLKSHIKGALYFDLEIDLSAPVSTHGGRHPLPDLHTLVNKLSAAGIDDKVTVIAYDDQNGAFASRFWWLLKYLGHTKVYVLNGNFSHWKHNALPVTDEIPTFERKEFKPNIQSHMAIEMSELRDKVLSKDSNVILIDSREPKRYLGLEEPIDKKAGRIPGAVNYFWKESLSEDGYWKNAADLEVRFSSIPKDKEIIVYCGSGVTACPNYLSLTEAGFQNVRLYVGSWSDWISYSDNPIEKSST